MHKTLVGMCLVGLLMVGGCSSKDDSSSTADPVSACKSVTSEICAKVFGCLTKEQQDAGAAEWGNNESDCKTKLATNNCTAEKTKCDSGTSYDSSDAAECLHQWQSLSCNEFTDPATAMPAACMTNALCH